ncbi:Conserved_hypothetical protein [Hexamita inflata]|uniref:Uncharacterized protein n=1 Tax=Hexamita inflata TaxID=28002 RepID=A0AA86PR89_9EUKA|nr:Conserved hypothetical protein [Hexamita inflata]
MLIVLAQVIKQQQSNIEQQAQSLSSILDQSVNQFKTILNIESISDFFKPIPNYNMQPGALVPFNKAKWNKLMNITKYAHQDLLNYLEVHKQPCHVRRPVNAKEMDIFNGRIVDLNNVDVIQEDETCEDSTFLEAMKNTTFNSLFPITVNSSRVSNRYSSVFLADLTTDNQYRYPASGNGFDDVTCFKDQFAQIQQIIIGFGSESNDLLRVRQKVVTQDINVTKSYSNNYEFEDRCIDRSIRVFVQGTQQIYNQAPQNLSVKQIKDFLSSTQLIDPTVEQIISALDQIKQEVKSNQQKSILLNNISSSDTFRPTEVLILASCVDTFQIRFLQTVLKKHQSLFDALSNMNIHVDFKTPSSSPKTNNCQDLKFIINKGGVFDQINNESQPQSFRIVPAQKDEFGQISFAFCSKTDKYLICSKIPQQGYLIQPSAQILFETFGQVFIMNKDNLFIYVDSFNQSVGQQFGWHVGSDINQSTLNIIQSNITATFRLFDTMLLSTQIDNNLIYMIYLRLPNSYTSVLPNTQVGGLIKFNASNLCFNLSYYDQQCINKLNIYFPQNYIGSNSLSPHDSIYLKGVTMTVDISQKLALFLETEFDFSKTNQSTYYSIFKEAISDAARFFIALSQQRSYDAIKNTYDMVKQYFDDILYVGRTTVSGPMALYPDNKMTQNTFKTIHNISLTTIIDNVVSNTSLVLKEFMCEFYTDSGVNQDRCLFVGLPFTNYLLAQDFFVVRESSAFLLFLQNNKQILVDLDKSNLKFQLNSMSWDSLSYKCSTQDYQMINQILLNQGFGNCQQAEETGSINYNFYVNKDLFKLKNNLIQTHHVFVPLNSSKSVMLVFKSNYLQDFEYICEQSQQQSVTRNKNSNIIKTWTQQQTILQKAIIKTKNVIIYICILGLTFIII